MYFSVPIQATVVVDTFIADIILDFGTVFTQDLSYHRKQNIK